MESLRTPAKTAPAGCGRLIKAFVQSCIGWLHRRRQDGWSRFQRKGHELIEYLLAGVLGGYPCH